MHHFLVWFHFHFFCLEIQIIICPTEIGLTDLRKLSKVQKSILDVFFCFCFQSKTGFPETLQKKWEDKPGFQKSGSMHQHVRWSTCVLVYFSWLMDHYFQSKWQLCSSRTILSFVFKVWTFWKGHKIWNNLPPYLWRYLVVSKKRRKIVSNFVAFSKYLNFNLLSFT